MIIVKNNKEIELMTKSGNINYECHKLLEKYIKDGITTIELNNIAESFIRENNAEPSFLNYNGYPMAICTSINDEVVHGIPDKRKLSEGDIISIDIGVIYECMHSDCAKTYIVGKAKNKQDELLVKATNEALLSGLEKVKAGAKLGDVSSAIEAVAKKYNLGVIRELAGHGIGASLHEEPDILNYGKSGSGITLEEGMTLAIEPMFTLGSHEICILENDWTIVTKDGSNAAHCEHTIVVTKESYKILTGDKKYG